MVFNLGVACGLFSLSEFLLNSVILVFRCSFEKRKIECFKMLTGLIQDRLLLSHVLCVNSGLIK